MTLPEPLRQKLGRLKEQGCPATLIERAMGMDVHIGSMIQFTSHSKKFNSIEFQVGNVFIGLHSDGLTTVRVINEPFEERIEIPPPKGDA